MPQHLIDAVLAIEDRRFYEHDGVDYEGTTRALFQNLDAGEIEQGGSTITQQLVKNTMGDPEKRDLKTKIREAVLARPARERDVEERDPRALPERHLPRERRVRREGRGRALLRQAQIRSSSRSASPRCSPG